MYKQIILGQDDQDTSGNNLVAYIPNDTELTILDLNGGSFVKIRDSNGNIGYIRSINIKII